MHAERCRGMATQAEVRRPTTTTRTLLGHESDTTRTLLGHYPPTTRTMKESGACHHVQSHQCFIACSASASSSPFEISCWIGFRFSDPFHQEFQFVEISLHRALQNSQQKVHRKEGSFGMDVCEQVECSGSISSLEDFRC